MKKKFDYQEYVEYIKSAKWLIKKSKFVQHYLKQKMPIECNRCGGTQNLQVHHVTYARLFKEKFCDLMFLCIDCHKFRHENKPAFQAEMNKKFDDLLTFFEEYYGKK